MRKLVLTSTFVLAALLGSACLVDRSGLPGSSQGAGGEATSTSGSSASASGGAGGAGTSASASTGCTPTAEICDNGVDDDCNGLIDCADPACDTPTGGLACIAAAPAGWAIATRFPGAANLCPPGYGSAVQVAAPPTSASATCDCSCGAAVSNPCTQGQLTIKSGLSCTAETIVSNVTGGCDALGATLIGPHKSISAPALKAVSVACGATVNKPASVPSSVDTLCGPPVSPAGGCAGDQICFPRVAAGQLCIHASGDMACPAGSPFTARQVVGAPGAVTDQRTCGACACTSIASACSGATFTAYTDAGCTANPVSALIDGSCGAASNNASFQNESHFIYQAIPNTLVCTPSTASPALVGSFQLSSPITLCCQP
jgi:hypothetical protein